jgi:TonB family protein
MSNPVISAGWEGRVIDGRFALHEWLGGSETSGVFRTDLQQPIAKKGAIKLIPAAGAEADSYLSRWAKAANLSHPHLMRVFRSGRFQFGAIGLVYVVTECADEVLAQILAGRALTTEETREMLGPVIEGLGYLHEKGFVHGRLKPSNILVVEDQLKISGDDVAAGGSLGPYERLSVYDAPEAPGGALTAAAEVWALGITLVETLTQRAPEWDPGSSEDPKVPDGMPRLFAEIARNCLRRDPEERCTLSEIRAHLEPSQPIEIRAGRAETGRAVTGRAETVRPTEATALAPGPLEEPVDTGDKSDAALTKKFLLPLVAGLVLAVALVAVFLLRSRTQEEDAAQRVQAPNASAQGGAAESGQQSPAPSAQQDSQAGSASDRQAGAPSATDGAPAAQRATPKAPLQDSKQNAAQSAKQDSTESPARGTPHGFTEKGAVIEQKLPSVTEAASRTIHGKVTVAVRVEVDASGNVTDASFKSEGPSKYFARAALEAARGWKFKAAAENGQPVPSVWVLRFRFRQTGAEADATEETR